MTPELFEFRLSRTADRVSEQDDIDSTSGRWRRPLMRAPSRTFMRSAAMFRSISPNDRALESSIVPAKSPTDDVAGTDASTVSPRDADSLSDERDMTLRNSPGRLERIVALLARPEAIAFLDQLLDTPADPSRLGAFLLESSANLHTLAQLVQEDLLRLSDGRLFISDLATRVIESLSLGNVDAPQP